MENIKIVSSYNFDYSQIVDIPVLKKQRKNNGGNRLKYKDITCAFDIETTGIDDIEHAIMYIWMFAFGKDTVVIGRTWEDFLYFASGLSNRLDIGESIPIYVHNLSYEFSFLKGIYDFQTEDVFCMDRRKPLKCFMYDKRLEFRCSYYQTNMSLEAFTDKMNVKHKKLSGEDFDYSKKRYPWTELTEKELDYCINDVVGLVEAIEVEMSLSEDNLDTIPPTSTGYVRRDTKRAVKDMNIYYKIQDLQPDYDLYAMLSEAFRGGNCHANRIYAGRILSDVDSFDRASSYPDVMCNCDFPMRKFRKINMLYFDKLLYFYDKHIPFIVRVVLKNVSLKKPWYGAPYLAKHKCWNTIGAVIDNGRILEAEQLATTLTDIDLAIVIEQYNFDIEISDGYKSAYDKLPQAIIDTNIEYFKRKTELKGVEGQELYYMLSKNKLNSVYGMSVQSPVKQSIYYVDYNFVVGEENEKEILERNTKKAFLSYAWGVWVTAWARWRLEEAIKLVGKNFIYADTDSVKFLSNQLDFSIFDEYNKKRIEESKKSGAYAKDRHGKIHYMGVYEHDAHYDRFVTLGAKKYAYEQNGNINLTVAGVNKKKGGAELKRFGGLEAFKEGFIFSDAGGTESVFNDKVDFDYVIDGHTINIKDNLYLKPSTYTLGITAEYFNIIHKFKSYYSER